MKKSEAIGLALQIVFEYENWGDEHVSDMLSTYTETGERPPCTGDELYDLCQMAEKEKKKGLDIESVEKVLKKGTKKKKATN